MRSAIRASVAVVAASIALSGCIEEFDPASRIDNARPLGVRVSVVDEPSRAWPRDGESIEVSWLVAQPKEAAPLTWAFVVCPAAPTSTGPALCSAAPLAVPCAGEPSNDAPRFTVSLPTNGLEESDRLAMFGLICAGGTLPFGCVDGVPQLPAGGGGSPLSLESFDDLNCIGDGSARMLVTSSIPIQRGETTNQNPVVEDVRLAGQVWPEPTDAMLNGPVEGCPAEGELVVSRSTPEVELAIRVPASSLEAYRSADGARELRESILVSHYVTAGELANQYSFIDPGATEATISWKPPTGSVVGGGLRVRFFFIIRDGRGGSDWWVRTACVM